MKGESWMKNTTLTLTFNTERLDALAYHMGKKEADLKEELSDYLQKMYETYVPQTTREYLDDKIARESSAKSYLVSPKNFIISYPISSANHSQVQNKS